MPLKTVVNDSKASILHIQTVCKYNIIKAKLFPFKPELIITIYHVFLIMESIKCLQLLINGVFSSLRGTSSRKDEIPYIHLSGSQFKIHVKPTVSLQRFWYCYYFKIMINRFTRFQSLGQKEDFMLTQLISVDIGTKFLISILI